MTDGISFDKLANSSVKLGEQGLRADITLEITFNINDLDKTAIITNAKKEAVSEILEAWLSCQVGQGKDENEPTIKDEYKIKIQLDLSTDTFYTSSDTENKSLTCGLILDMLGRLDKIKISNLS